ncbi:hypothetical protein OEZ85_006640 [Tetradesmus obliquus]|uniref:Uncharacterized protein n=1 Tax=Tetradesmus obliquus TaxID=3088 RepID=A0ABY8TVL5_TETOB|nr:hypothetical protein OEZ85_006640 [Tetradesmus obliquus]
MFAPPPATIFFNPFITPYGRVTRSDSFGFPWVRIAEPGMRNCRSQGRWQLHQSGPGAAQAPTAAADATHADPSTCNNTSNATNQTLNGVPSTAPETIAVA